MNQAIQFPDREVWDEARQCIAFPALVNGMQLTCALTLTVLKKRFGGEEPAQWLVPLFVNIAGIWKMKPRISFSTSKKMLKVGSGFPEPGNHLSTLHSCSLNIVARQFPPLSGGVSVLPGYQSKDSHS